VPYTLLLADDSVTIQRVIELTFADEDVTVIAVSDGDQAIERLEASPPDIVLADIGMPGKNGYEVAQFIRRTPKLAHIPVVLLTGAFEPVDQARANEAGCDGVLAKPFEPQLVIGRVRELLARPRAAAAPAPGPSPAAADAGPASTPVAGTTPSTDSIWAQPAAAPRPVTPLVDAAIPAAKASSIPRAELNDYFDRLDAAFSNLSSNAPPAAASPAPPKPPAEPPAPPAADIDWFDLKTDPTPATNAWEAPSAAAAAPVDRPPSSASPQPAIETPASLDEALSFAPPDDRFAPIEESRPVGENTFAAHPEPVTDDPFVFVAPVAPAAAAPLAAAPVHAAPIEAPRDAAPVATPPALELPLPHPPALPSLPDAFAALLAAEQVNGEPAAELWPATPAPEPAAISDEVIEEVVRRVLDRLSDAVVRDAVAEATSKVAERLVREEIERIKASIR
jgi:CheY-like chemotaxis protein